MDSIILLLMPQEANIVFGQMQIKNILA